MFTMGYWFIWYDFTHLPNFSTSFSRWLWFLKLGCALLLLKSSSVSRTSASSWGEKLGCVLCTWQVKNLPTLCPGSLDSEAWSWSWSSPLRLRWTFSETWSFPAQHEGLFKITEKDNHTERIKKTGITLNLVKPIIGLSWIILQPIVTVKLCISKTVICKPVSHSYL